MVFSSLAFLFHFLPVFLIVYYAVPAKQKNLIVLLGSLVFYTYGEHFFIILLLLSIVVNYLIGRQMEQQPRKKRLMLLIGLVYNFGLLVFFKYINFLIENLNALFHFANANIPTLSVTLPLGISFYTFQIVSYIVDVYRGEQKAVKNIVNLGAYLCMFPQLVAGPIVTYSEIEPTLLHRECKIADLEKGLKTFILGLSSKTLLANPMGSLWATTSRYGYDTISTPFAWLGAYAYSFQIYFDFAGYSLMAIGLGQMMGLYIPKNFDHPYISGSMTEFWRRWHMTLGRWFKKYLYFPLGGSRCSTAKTIRNTLIVWAFTGLWHGASWNFVLWGLIFFVLLTIERLGFGNVLKNLGVVKHIYVILLIPLTWVVFALTNMHDLGTYFARMFPFFSVGQTANGKDILFALKDYWYILLACIAFCLPYPARIYEKYKDTMWMNAILLGLFIFSGYRMATQGNNPFLYFRF